MLSFALKIKPDPPSPMLPLQLCWMWPLHHLLLLLDFICSSIMNHYVPWTAQPISNAVPSAQNAFPRALHLTVLFSSFKSQSNITTSELPFLTISPVTSHLMLCLSPCLAQLIMVYFIYLFIVLECKLLVRTVTDLFKLCPDVIKLNKYLLNTQKQLSNMKFWGGGGFPGRHPVVDWGTGWRSAELHNQMTHPETLVWKVERVRENECTPVSCWEGKARQLGPGITVCGPGRTHHSFSCTSFTLELVGNAQSQPHLRLNESEYALYKIPGNSCAPYGLRNPALYFVHMNCQHWYLKTSGPGVRSPASPCTVWPWAVGLTSLCLSLSINYKTWPYYLVNDTMVIKQKL